MIIPTPEFDPLFATDGVPFQQKMLRYIEREFADLLQARLDVVRELRNLAAAERASPSVRRENSVRAAA